MNHLLRIGALAALGIGCAHAVMIDEIQVYTDDINAPGKFGLELHLNLTLSGRRVPDYPGEITPHRGIGFRKRGHGKEPTREWLILKRGWVM